MKKIRVYYQVFFLGLFLFLLMATDLSYLRADGGGYPVRLFLELNPLTALGTALSAHALRPGLLLALITVVATVLLGRVFCGWICPLGVLNHFFGNWMSERSAKEKRKANRSSSILKVKYYILAALLLMAAGGSLQIGWLDPITLLTRSMAVFVQPASQQLGQSFGLDGPDRVAIAIGIVLLAAMAGWLASRWTHPKRKKMMLAADAGLAAVVAATLLTLFASSPTHGREFHWGFWATLLFLAALIANRFVPRFWCRAICPLGALLGLMSRFSLFEIHRDRHSCTNCGLCATDCQGACDPDGALLKSECFVCLNCRDVCPESSLSYRFIPPVVAPASSLTLVSISPSPGPNLSRRWVLGAASAGVLWTLGARVGGGDKRDGAWKLIRPPGSLAESGFLRRCLKCGACMRVCPTNAIQPAMSEAGVEGLWTPIMVFRVGACERECNLCGQVCPTGAIRGFSLDEKLARGKFESRGPIRIGTAFIDRGRCLPWANGAPCVVCQEVCPVSPKAILTTPDEVGLPRVAPELCTGCGICERECPVADQRAIRVSSVGESRSSENQMLLGGSSR